MTSFVVSKQSGTNAEYGRLLNGHSYVKEGSLSLGSIGTSNTNHYVSNTAILFKETLFIVRKHSTTKIIVDAVNGPGKSHIITTKIDTTGYTNEYSYLGLYKHLNIDGEETLSVVYTVKTNISTNEIRTSSTVDGQNWTDNFISGGSISTTLFSITKAILYENTLFFGESHTNSVYTLNLIGLSLTTYTFPSSDLRTISWNVHGGTLYAAIRSGTTIVIYRYTGSFPQFTVISGAISMTLTTPAFFSWPDDTSSSSMYIIYSGFNSSTTKAWKINSTTGIIIDISSNVIPTSIGGLGDWSIVKEMTYVGSTPSYTIHLWQESTDLVYYKWVNDTTQLAGETYVGPAGSYVLPNDPVGDGSRQWTPGQLNIEITKIKKSVGGEEITFVAHGDSLKIQATNITTTFQIGEVITGGTSGATAIVVDSTKLLTSGYLLVGGTIGTFQVGETITGGTSSSTATISTTPTGAHPTRKVRFFYSKNEGWMPPSPSATLVTSTVTPTDNGEINDTNTIYNIVADGVTEYKVLRNVVADGLVDGDVEHLIPMISV